MCGIVGYIGTHEASPILVAGLRRLEYRGYDSAGVATLDGDRLVVRKRAGRVRVLEEALDREPAAGSCGISHTRWATHGSASDRNAHPHVGGKGNPAVAVVHNGVIENHDALRRELEADGFSFRSQTDTEVIAHLIARELGDGDELFAAVQRALPRLEGTYGLAVVSPRCPGEMVGSRLGSPLVVGLGDGEHFLASDAMAIAPHTAQVAYLQDGESVRLTTARLRDPPSGARVDHPEDRPDRLEARRGRAGRARALHAQGDPRAARHGRRRVPGPDPPRRGDGAVRRAEPHDAGNSAGSAASSSPPAARAGTRRSWANTSSSGWRTCRSRSSTPASSATGTPRWTTARSSSCSASRARRPTRSGRSARRNGEGSRPWRSSTPSAARSPARPTAASTSTPVPRSASPAPRRSRPRWRS